MENCTLTQKQREIIVGCILGDLHLQTQSNGKTFRCCFEQGGKKFSHKEYLLHLYDYFQGFCTPAMVPKKVANKRSNWAFSTRSLPIFSFYGNLFYAVDPKTGKRVKRLPTRPNLLQKFITPLSLAYWFMDDGSRKSNKSKGIILNTQNFTLKEVQFLCDILKKKFGLKAKPREQKKLYEGELRIYHQIYISGHSFERLHELIYEHIHPSMRYKWPPPRKRKKVQGNNAIQEADQFYYTQQDLTTKMAKK